MNAIELHFCISKRMKHFCGGDGGKRILLKFYFAFVIILLIRMTQWPGEGINFHIWLLPFTLFCRHLLLNTY